MRHVTTVVGLGMLFLFAVSCGGSDRVGFGGAPTTGQPAPSVPPSQPPGGAPPSVGLPPLTATAPAGATAVPAAQVDASGLPGGFPTTVWTSEQGRVVGLYGRAGGCTTASADLVGQDAHRVVIRLVQTTVSEGPCPQVLYFPALTVRLEAPLGTRTVALIMPRAIHGPPPTK